MTESPKSSLSSPLNTNLPSILSESGPSSLDLSLKNKSDTLKKKPPYEKPVPVVVCVCSSGVGSGMVLGRGIGFRLRVSGFLLLDRRCLDGRQGGSGLLFFWVLRGSRLPTLDPCLFQVFVERKGLRGRGRLLLQCEVTGVVVVSGRSGFDRLWLSDCKLG